jgi:hypothetical protein
MTSVHLKYVYRENVPSHFALPKNCGCVWEHLSAFLVRVSSVFLVRVSFSDIAEWNQTSSQINFGGRFNFVACSFWDCSFLCVLQPKKLVFTFRFISSVFEKKPDYRFSRTTLQKVFLNLDLYFLSLLSIRWCIFQ